MRLIYSCLSLAILGIAARAAATSCAIIEPPWDAGEGGPLDRSGLVADADGVLVPVDAQPWEKVPCGQLEPAVTGTCELVDEDGISRVTLQTEQVGAEFCERPHQDRLGDTHAYYVRRFIPPMPLTPGRGYSIECQDPVHYPGSFRVRDSNTPAAPAAIAITETHRTRGDDGGCCGDELDVIELRLADMDPAFLREGGYIEAVVPSGQHLAFIRPEGDRFVVPQMRELIELTPVSASGVRGETRMIDGSEVDGEIVYIPCDVTGRRPAHALWLLMPMAWIYAMGRRRRRSA